MIFVEHSRHRHCVNRMEAFRTGMTLAQQAQLTSALNENVMPIKRLFLLGCLMVASGFSSTVETYSSPPVKNFAQPLATQPLSDSGAPGPAAQPKHMKWTIIVATLTAGPPLPDRLPIFPAGVDTFTVDFHTKAECSADRNSDRFDYALAKSQCFPRFGYVWPPTAPACMRPGFEQDFPCGCEWGDERTGIVYDNPECNKFGPASKATLGGEPAQLDNLPEPPPAPITPPPCEGVRYDRGESCVP
jgi:hypothetical protein